jgi:hypothetical protein
MVKYRNLIKIEYMILKGRFLAHPFASTSLRSVFQLRASARNDRALLVSGVRRELRLHLTPLKKMEGVIPNETASLALPKLRKGDAGGEMRNLHGEYVEVSPPKKRKFSLVI